ncbi:MAG: MFS transporter [Mycobacteriales bacterium]|nr:MFS transporter [Frankia sp.]
MRQSRFAVLRERDFRLFLIGHGVSFAGDFMLPVALSFAVLEKYNSAGALGVVLTAHSLPLVLFLLIGGVVADRAPRRSVLIASDSVSCVMQALAAALLFTDGWQLWQLAALEAVRGTAHAFASPTYAGFIPEVASAPRLQEANALRQVAWSTAQVVGPALAGVIVVVGGGAVALAVNAATFGVSALCLLAIPPRPAIEREQSSMLADLRDGWREFRSRTWLWVVVAQFGVFHLLVLPPIYVLGALVSKTHYGGAKPWATTLTVLGLGSVVGGLVALHVRVRRPLLVATICGLGYGLFALMLAARAPLVALVGAAALSGAGFAMFGALWETTLMRLIPADKLSRVSAYDWFGSIALLPIGYAIVGPLAGVFGVSTVLWIAVVTHFVLAAIVLCVPAVTTLRADTTMQH